MQFFHEQLETIEHLFFNCCDTGLVWRDICAWVGMKRAGFTLSSVVKCCKKDFGGARLRSKAVTLAFCATIHTIWKARNENIFPLTDQGLTMQIKVATYKILYRLYPPEMIDFLFFILALERDSVIFVMQAMFVCCVLDLLALFGMPNMVSLIVLSDNGNLVCCLILLGYAPLLVCYTYLQFIKKNYIN
ncbi:unnamed protein product, partial [Cuscuta epithymum]